MIKLNKKYKIGFDPLNIILYKTGTKGDNAKNRDGICGIVKMVYDKTKQIFKEKGY